MNWAEQADRFNELEERCRALAEFVEAFEDAELSARVMLVAARGHALEDMFRDDLRREDELKERRP